MKPTFRCILLILMVNHILLQKELTLNSMSTRSNTPTSTGYEIPNIHSKTLKLNIIISWTVK